MILEGQLMEVSTNQIINDAESVQMFEIFSVSIVKLLLFLYCNLITLKLTNIKSILTFLFR